jgi:hypothetical protein
MMARHGYVLDEGNPADARVTGDDAVRTARETYRLFTSEDPVATAYYLVTTPTNSGSPAGQGSPSVIKPLNRTPVWVVYAKAQMLKDERDPSQGWVEGTVIILVDALTGEPLQGIWF